jgi:hypothetical protein
VKFTLNNQQIFPAGTAVKVYLRSNWPGSVTQPTGEPLGAVATEAVVAANGAVVLEGLTEKTAYFAAALVGSVWRYVGFQTAIPKASAAQAETDIAAEQARAETAESLKLAKALNLSDLASSAAARSNLGLGSAATQASTAFDVVGAAATEEARAKAAEAANAASITILNLGTDWSAGDNVTVYAANPDGGKGALHDGTAAAPVTIARPTFKISRVSGVTGGVTGDGSTELATIYGASTGTAASKVQEIGVMGSAKNVGTEGTPDACGIYAVGRILPGGTGRAFGGFAAGWRSEAAQRATGYEIYVENGGGADTYDITNGAETTKGIYIHAGTAKIAVGVQVTSITGTELPSVDVGFGINKFAAATAGFQDNSESERAFQVEGKHAKAAISVAAGSGIVVIGNKEKNFAGSQIFEAYFGEEALDPGFVIGTGQGKSVSGIFMRNSTGQMKIFASNAANAFLTGTAQGDTGINFTAGKVFHIGAQTKTSLLRVSETGLGFFGAAAAARSAAYTQTYSTAARTHVEAELPTNISATLVTEIDTSLNTTNKAVNELKKLINSVIDDQQLYGLFA